MRYLLFTLTAEQPLLLTSLQGDPNSSVSFSYIPGSVLRGALIGRYQQQGRQFDPADATIRRLFLDGSTRFLNAYPFLTHEGRTVRSLPLPRSLFIEKGEQLLSEQATDAYDLSAPFTAYSDDGEEEEGAAPKPYPDTPRRLNDGYMLRDARDTFVIDTVALLVNIHNQRHRQYGRGTEDEGAVFRYEAVAPGQHFRTVVICEHDSDADQLRTLLQPKRLWLGGARSAGYGEVTVSDDLILETWRETERSASVMGDILHLTLLSDLIIRDTIGHYAATLPLDALGQALGGVHLTIDRQRSFQTTTLHGGFNRTWGLPLPQTAALAAGSVFVLHCDPIPTAAAVARLEETGLGERRAEGFGRLAFGWLPGKRNILVKKPKPIHSTPSTLQTQAARAVARQMAERLLIQRLDPRLVELVDRYQINGDISNTQLSRLRIIARRAIVAPTAARMQQVSALLTHLPTNAREQYERARIGARNSQGLRSWLDKRLQPPDPNTGHRGYFTDWDDPNLAITVGDEQAVVTDELATRYTLRLIMAVARLAVKEVR
jgi:CRISPR-associated protein Csx10